MDKAQTFITDCLFTKNFDDPNKPISENRLQSTLLLLPTDGGLSSRLKRTRSKKQFTVEKLSSQNSSSIRHPNYRTINKNSRMAFKEYINNAHTNCRKAIRLAQEKKITSREELDKLLESEHKDLFDELPKYNQFLPMHETLWVGYMKELLNIPDKLTDSSKLSINGTMALTKLSMADYNGAILKVTKSKNKNMIGIEGIVIWDSQKNFIMITKGKLVDRIKCIPKKGTVFTFELPLNDEDALQYSILGDRFKYRSSDRASRKFKSRRCDDMLYYVNGS
ncbi:RNase P/RNase MRP complex subunit NDAI_0G05890 [Naumovozyma dairenensis CBS 421]|uniref:Ribonuclease P protein subunit n=1 Tax=Naumovozyma dairenensis (strain ATCC 10597 / BCRC 20456 / CBS 421 / NBRC 0211 / NRRL Y-12639) TaxID=1071378 RepID=J7RTK5_NAUDC|nr:hypothetical protein NDAI_0G05890 [Naumovozyma dairenensis CBS 421]CCK73572.1 hypothetical protein NDAI_0G05890 [Naumovozyma dairenensis CBS 421]